MEQVKMLSNSINSNNKPVPNLSRVKEEPVTNELLNDGATKNDDATTVREKILKIDIDDKQSEIKSEDKNSFMMSRESDADSFMKCIICNENFTDKFNLHKHITISHPEISDVVFCDLCDESFLNENELHCHISTDHHEEHKKFEKSNWQENHNENGKKSHQSSSSGVKEKPKHLKRRQLFYLKKYLQMTNQLYGKCDNTTAIRKTQRRIARRKWLRKQVELMSKMSRKNSKLNSLKEGDQETNDADKNYLQYPTSTVEIEDCPEQAVRLSESFTVGEFYSTDVSEKLNSSNETIADSSVSNSKLYGEFSDVSRENSSPLSSIHHNYSEEIEEVEFIDFSNNFDGSQQTSAVNSVDVTNHFNTEDKFDVVGKSEEHSDNINSTVSSKSKFVTSSPELKKKLVKVDMPNIKLESTLPNKFSACRTYLDKSFLQTVQKQVSSLKQNNAKSKIYCHMCNEIFRLMEQKCTKKIEGDKEVIKCLFCYRKFLQKTTLEKHVAFSHLNCECIKNLKPVKNFVISDIVRTSRDNQSSNTNYECTVCMKTFLHYENFNTHILNAHEISTNMKERLTFGKPEYLRRLSATYFLCKSSQVMNDERKNIMAMKKILDTNNSLVSCTICAMTFSSCATYIRHIKKSHNNVRPIEESSWYPFETNDAAITSSLILLDSLKGRNSTTDNSEKNLNELRKTCKRCNREFDSIRDLSMHFYLIHDDTSDNNQTAPTTLNSGERRTHDWYCLHCSQRFKLLQSYIRHRYFVHDDESMIHICDNCCKILTSIEMVNSHVCLNVNSWNCKQCSESFPTGIALRMHNTEKHFEVPGPYVCSTCEKKFLTKAMLMRHVQNTTCYSHVCPPEPSHHAAASENSQLKFDNFIEAPTEYSVNFLNAMDSKQNKEIMNIKNFDDMEVLQEDVLLRESTESAIGSPKKSDSPSQKSKATEEDKIYQCSMCKLYFLSKSGLKLHINRAHTSAVEICQLCYRMYDTGNLVRHIIEKHLKCDKHNEQKVNSNIDILSELRVHDIEKDTGELIELLGTKHLLALCEYQRHLELNFNHIACPRCSSAFETSEQYRLHNAQVHDKLCALCNIQFETGQDAAEHKTNTHGSIPCYVWFAHKLILAIGDTKTFEETAEKIIVETMIGNSGAENIIRNFNEIAGEETNDDQQDVIEDTQVRGSNDSSDEYNGESTNMAISGFDENSQDHLQLVEDETQEMEQKIFLTVDPTVAVEPSDEDDELRLFLVVTEQDLEKYKNNLTQFAERISSACNIFSTEDIEKLLQLYMKDSD